MQRKKKRLKILMILAIAALVLSLIIFSALVIYSKTLDYSMDESLFSAAKSSSVTKLYYDSENGAKSLDSYSPTVYEEIYGVTRKEWVSYAEISENLKNAFISMEDRRFFEHSGIDVIRTFGALLNYILHFKGNFGGSTITQQVVKNISGDNERSVKRKLNELFRAYHMEKLHSKEEIFETYLNIVELGDGIIGVGEAAEYYYGKDVKDLNIEEAATLVGMANAPTKYNPYNNPDLCREKRNRVLYSLFECGFINKDEYEISKASELSVNPRESKDNHIYSWFSETVIEDASQMLAEKLGVSPGVARKLLICGGYRIYTTVSPKIQETVEKYFENKENFPRAVSTGLEFSMVVSEPESGNLLATVGGVGKKSGNRILNYAETNITPGSTLKPLALYAPLLDSKKINWATVFDDVPVSFERSGTSLALPFPKNSPDVYDGLTTVKDAVRLSKNTVAVRLYSLLGAESIYKNLYENFGFTSLVRSEKRKDGSVLSDLSESPLALGQLTRGVTLRCLTEAYNVFPNEGELPCGRSFIAVFDSFGNLVLENNSESKRVFSSESARIMNKLLENVVEDGTAKSITLGELVDTAGKTGTSGGGKDKLFVGYTPYFTAGIWCGYKGTKRPVVFEGKTHLDIWNDISKKIYETYSYHEDERHFSAESLKYLPYCKDSGEIFSDICALDVRGDRMEWGYFTSDNLPLKECTRHVLVRYDELTEGIAGDLCPEENLKEIALVKIEDRSFPYEIEVTDAEYSAREFDKIFEYPRSFSVPYFYEALPEGEYAGKSKGKKQFNSPCYIHRE